MTLYGDIKMNLLDAKTGHMCELPSTVEKVMQVRGWGCLGDSLLGVKTRDDASETKSNAFGKAQRAVHASYAEACMAIEHAKSDSSLEQAIKHVNEIAGKIADKAQIAAVDLSSAYRAWFGQRAI
jgi:hypothetical protein